jgi:hypothetical protein
VTEAARIAARLWALHGGNAAELALPFALGHSAVASTRLGMRPEGEVIDDLRGLDGDGDPQLLEGVRTLLSEARDVEWPCGLPENNLPSAPHL